MAKAVTVRYGMAREYYGVDAPAEVGAKRVNLGPALAGVVYGAAIWAARLSKTRTRMLVYPEAVTSYDEIAELMNVCAPRS